MAVRFIIGRAGSGKTKHCFDKIVRHCRQDPLGPPIYWLLPKQATFQAERELACHSGLPTVCRASVFSFSQLGQLINQQCGGIAIPETSAVGRQMILGHLLRTHQKELRFFQSVARQPGLAAELDVAFAEFERYGKSADDVLAYSAGADGAGPLVAKLHDLRLLYDAYTRYLGQDRLDQHQRQKQVIDCIRDWRGLRRALIYVDGFLDFAEQERRLLCALARGACALEITILMDPASLVLRDSKYRPDAMSLFHRTEQAFGRLVASFNQENIAIDDPLLLHGNHRSSKTSLRLIERDLFGRLTQQHPLVGRPDTDVCLIETPSRRAEIDAVARHIRNLLRGGLRLRDIAVLARDLNPYHDLIAASFAEHELPCFIDRRRSAAHHPLVRFTRLLPTLAAGQWPHETMIALLKTRLLPLGSAEADELENYVLAHRIRGVAWVAEKPWAFRSGSNRSGRDRDDADRSAEESTSTRIDATRLGLVEPFLGFSALLSKSTTLPVRRFVEHIFAVFEKVNIRQMLETWISQADAVGDFEDAAAHEQIWNEITGLFDGMVDLLGDEAVTPSEFADILETGLERFDLALTPQTVDQILVGAVDRTRTPELKAVVLIGWHDGGFPRRPVPSAILSDSDRDQMAVGGNTERLLLDERLLAYFAVSRSSEHLCITRPCADDAGKLLAPSPFWSRLEKLCPDADRTTVKHHCDEDCIATPSQLTTALMRWARKETAGDDPSVDAAAPWPALYQWFANHSTDGGQEAALREKSWPALRYSNQASLSPQIARRLFSSPFSGQIARIESFNACPFQHFASFGLGLRERDNAEVTGMDLSRVYHAVLNNVVAEMIRIRRDGSDPSPHTAGMIHAQTQSIGRHLRDEIMLSNSRNQYLLQRVEKTLEQVMAAQEAAIRRGQFRPTRTDVRFGPDAPLPPLSLNTAAGNRVELSGKIDRVDLLSSPHGVHASAVDYRLGSESLSIGRVYHGLSLQLLAYLLVLQANGQTLVGRPLTPAAAFYVRLLRQLQDVDHPGDAIPPEDPAFDLQVKPRGVFDAQYLSALDAALVTGASDVVQVFVNKDGKLGKQKSSDAAAPNDFAALLQLVKKRIGQAVDRLLTGDINVMPVRIRQDSPCARCDLKSVCRFDRAVNRYRVLEPLDKEEALARAGTEIK